MADVLQLEKPVEIHDVPRLLIEWPSPWREFVTAIRPALARSEARLAGEAPYGMFPYRGMIPVWLMEAFLIFAAIVVPVKLAELRPQVAPRLSSHDIIYYSGDELPRTEDLGGAQAGRSGQAGGDEAHNRTQTIKIARGGSLTPKVVDAPNLRLPSTLDAVANLLAIKPNPGPPPVEGLRSTRTLPSLAAAVVAPAPSVIRDYTRNGITMDAVVPPAPNFSRDQPLTAPTLNANVIPPAPNASREHTLVAPALGPAVIPPAPSVSGDRRQTAPSLSVAVVAPAPTLAGDLTQKEVRAAPSLAASVIPPAPGAVSRDITSAPVQMTNVAVVPPPASAPERATTRDPKLTLPAPSVIAPPPSADVSRDLQRLASGSIPDPSKTVVPPPPTQSGSGSFMSSLIGKIFGTSEVVPPPPTVNANATRNSAGTALAATVVPPPPSVGAAGGAHARGARDGAGASLATNVVPPPPSVAATSGSNPQGVRNGTGATFPSNVIAPPPSAGISGGTSPRSLSPSAAPSLGPPSIVPPPPSLSGPGGGTGSTGGGMGVSGGTLIASNVVPPPPTLGGGPSATGSGLGRRGAGLGAPLDVGSPAAPANSGGSSTNAGVVASSHPGSKIALPSTGGTGALSMSPSGGDKPGLGGSGGGTGIGRGTGPGSGMKGESTGAGNSGPGRGSDPNARGGISPSPGPGGAGTAPSGTPAVPGVSVSGGSVQVSFDTDPAAANDASAPPRRSSLKQRQILGVDVVSTATSAGAFEPYKNLLHGEKHTTYVDTPLGTVVMEYADEAAAGHANGTFTAPQQIRADFPAGLPHVRMVVACILDATGNLKNPRVLEAGPADMTAKVLAALRSWKFQPALRGSEAIEVTAILGFNIDTNDRF